MIVGSSGFMATLGQAKSPDNSTTFAAEGGNRLPVEKKSYDSVQISEAETSKMLQEASGFVDVTGENGMYKLGLMTLGRSTIEEWSVKGMEVSDEAIIAAGKAFQDAFKKTLDESGSLLAGSSLALNKHQIVINAQEVPDWFDKDYANTLSSMDINEMKSAFENGELFFISSPSALISGVLDKYTSVAKII